MRDFTVTFLQVETTGFNLSTDRVVLVAWKAWSLVNGCTFGQEAETFASCPNDALNGLTDRIVVAPKPEFAFSWLEKDAGSIRTKQRIDLCSLAAPLLLCGHVASTSLDALAVYFGVPDTHSKLDTMAEVWEGLLAAYLLKEGP